LFSADTVRNPKVPNERKLQLTIAVETVGYIGRAMSAKQSPNWTTGPYIIQSTLLLIAPALFAASIYMELGRIIVLVRGEKFALVRVNWTTKIFVGGDVLSFLMQASGTVATSLGKLIGC
jgi:hypothetical protein